MKFNAPVPWVSAILLAGCYSPNFQVSATKDGTGENTGSSPSSTGPTIGDASSSNSTGRNTADTGGGPGVTDDSSGGANAAPVANDDALYAVQDEQLLVEAPAGLLANDGDGDGDGLTVLAADASTDHGGAVVVGVDGEVSYVPAIGFWGPDLFGYTITDGFAEASATVTVYVAPRFIPVSSVTGGLGGFAIDGEGVYDRAGRSVSGAGDVNGDGLADLIVGAPYADANGVESGRSYVVFGKADTTTVNLANPLFAGFAIDGEVSGDSAGRAVSSAGDVNGDGLADLVVGAPYADPNGVGSGRIYVVFGKPATATVDLGDVAMGLGGFALNGNAGDDFAGNAVSGAGDVNGDGLADVIILARGADTDGDLSSRSYVVFGKADTANVELDDIVTGIGGFAVHGEADAVGASVSGAGDVDGDGLGDLIIGMETASTPNGIGSGRSYVVFGKPETDAVQLADIVLGAGGFALDGEVAGDQAGSSVRGAGDFNADGLADLIVGAPGADFGGSNSGRTYVVFGKGDTSPVDLSAVAMGAGGFALDGASPYDFSGTSVSGLDDINGDGRADVVVGASAANPNGSDSGRIYAVFGRQAAASADLGDIAMGLDGFALDGEADSDLAGGSVSWAGDVNGDGVADLVVGASGAAPDGVSAAGRSYVVFGVPTGPT